ncbi:AAA family ATPase [Sulfuritalea hydrogenivorans]|uniref:Transcriptional activator domain protein n=1 Tax=Sulfuritalea hydrogenivorans sk43H TaxID=1223802 RepID=W0SGJ5_9PROT|nr:AAA family ATPase [Sulfuritalea hydrogenivorans]BAO30161.1 transcriptional activator domain protein [Sulfuritalea hydrogenivorans sk43H]
MNSSPRLQLRLLGGFTLDRDGEPCKLAYEKGRALLAYLAMEPARTHTRSSLASMFWPDLAHDAALANLRQILHSLRQTLNAASPATPLLRVDRESVRLDPEAGLAVDAVEFSAAPSPCPATPDPAHCMSCIAGMEAMERLLGGEFMDGFALPECPGFEEWLQVQREAMHLHALGRLVRLSDCHERMGACDKSLPFAQRFLELEPWNEEGLRRVMRLLALNGQRANALARHEAFCRTLKKDLSVLPSDETHMLAERIQRGELSPDRRRMADALPVAAPPPAAAERRQVTVLYCELVAVGVDDPDEALALLREPQALCSEIIRDKSGYLVQIRGGSLLAYFGYPRASENAARLAVQAALEVTRTAFAGLELRASVHTGMVISGDRQVPDAIGATSGLAIRLRQLADRGEVAISAATQRLVAGYFDCLSLGQQHLSGVTRPLEVFRVSRESGARDRLEAASALTPLIGRKREIASLLALWRETLAGKGRFVLLRGEAGIGKSRLVLALKDAIPDPAARVRELRCVPEHSQSPFHPLTALFGFTLAFSSEDSPASKFDKLAAYVETNYPKNDPDTVALLARMLGLPVRAPYREPASSPQQQRERTLAILLDRLCLLASRQPMLLVVEDLHWADPSTLELLNLFIQRTPGVPILTVLAARPGFKPSWDENLVPTLTLNALNDADTAVLIKAVAPEIPPASIPRIIERADGIPLFAEELAREIAATDQPAIPSTLHDLLMARLDGMGEAKTVAQLAAAIGREFSVDLLRKIAPFDDATLKALLGQLRDAGLLLGDIRSDMHFRHSLIRDAAYQSQTRDERAATHRRIGAALEAAGTGIRPEVLAQHWAAGGEAREAVTCWIAAGKLASQHSASQEALAHFKSGLALIEALPAGPERLRMELDLQIGLGSAATATQGYASAEGAAAYARAMALCDWQESGPDMFPAIWGLWASASSRDGYPHALELAHRLLRMADQDDDPIHAAQGHFAVADTLYWQADFHAAREHLEHAVATCLPAHHKRHVADFGEDAGVTAGSYLSWVLWFLGFPDQARETSRKTLVLARRLGHPYSLAYALTFAAILHCRLRLPTKALSLAKETFEVASQHGFPLWQIGAMLSSGWARVMQGKHDGIESLQHCVETTRAAMGGVTLVVLEPLVDAYVALELFDAALSVNENALATGSAIGDHHVDAELHRLKGESLRGLENACEAEACFHRALEISRGQHAKSLELRAAMSMARLWQTQGKRDEARCLLEEVYHWFTEGFGTLDLQNARELLHSLGGKPAS